jgi:hypothetical protein
MNKNNIKRDKNILLHIKREINLSTKSESTKKPKYTRKQKYKNEYL